MRNQMQQVDQPQHQRVRGLQATLKSPSLRFDLFKDKVAQIKRGGMEKELMMREVPSFQLLEGEGLVHQGPIRESRELSDS